jgi:hypothetical protein
MPTGLESTMQDTTASPTGYGLKGRHRRGHRKHTAEAAFDPAERRHYVYRLFDAAGDAVYIGRSQAPMDRLRAHHAAGAEWAPRVVGIEAWGPYTWADVLRREREAITAARPPGNKDFVTRKTHVPPVLTKVGA